MLALAAPAWGEAKRLEKPSVEPTPPSLEKLTPFVEQFEAKDAEAMPEPGGIVFVGSSSFRRWKTGEYFDDPPVLNRGFGGSTMADAAHFADRIVIPYKPKLVFVYEGDNDLGRGRSPQTLRDDAHVLAWRILQALPETRIVFVSIKPSPKRWNLEDKMIEANRLLEELTTRDDRLFYLDAHTPLLDEQGGARPELYSDTLHLNPTGYEIWASLFRAAIRRLYEPAAEPERS